MPATVALDLITDALYETGAYGPSDAIPAGDAALALRAFNRVIAASNTNRANIYTKRIDLWPTVGGQQSYTIGKDPDGITTANWDGDRPISIDQANLLFPTSPVVRRPLRIWDDTQWSDIRVQNINTYPEGLYNDGGFPFSRIYFKPIPDAVYQIELYTWQRAQQLADLSTELLYPDGYEDYWLYHLAIRLCGPFGRPVSADLRENARRAQEAIQSLNSTAPLLASDPMLQGGAKGIYNWLTGPYE